MGNLVLKHLMPMDSNGNVLQEGGVYDTGIISITSVLASTPRKLSIGPLDITAGHLRRIFVERFTGSGLFDITIFDHPTNEIDANIMYQEVNINTATNKVLYIPFNIAELDDRKLYLKLESATDGQDFRIRLMLSGSASIIIGIKEI